LLRPSSFALVARSQRHQLAHFAEREAQLAGTLDEGEPFDVGPRAALQRG
jgi:hypothetical protein